MAIIFSILLVVGIVALIFFVAKKMRQPTIADAVKKMEGKQTESRSASTRDRPERLKNFTLPQIPEGHQIYLNRAHVSGVQHYADQVWDLAAEKNPMLSWEADLENAHDNNAIQIFAGSGADRELIGFVDRELAAIIADYDKREDLAIRFAGAKAHENWLEVFYQITGPKSAKSEFLTLHSRENDRD